MHPLVYRLIAVVASLVVFALLGALIADNHGVNAATGAMVGGAVGIIFGLVADSGVTHWKAESRHFPPESDD